MGLDDVYDGRKQYASENTLKNSSLIINTRRGSLKKGAKEVRVVIATFGPEEIGWIHYTTTRPIQPLETESRPKQPKIDIGYLPPICD